MARLEVAVTVVIDVEATVATVSAAARHQTVTSHLLVLGGLVDPLFPVCRIRDIVEGHFGRQPVIGEDEDVPGLLDELLGGRLVDLDVTVLGCDAPALDGLFGLVHEPGTDPNALATEDVDD